MHKVSMKSQESCKIVRKSTKCIQSLNLLNLTLCMLGKFACFFVICGLFLKLTFSKKIFQEYHQCVQQFGSRSGPTFSRAYSGSKLLSKVISRQQQLPQAEKELNISRHESCFLNKPGIPET